MIILFMPSGCGIKGCGVGDGNIGTILSVDVIELYGGLLELYRGLLLKCACIDYDRSSLLKDGFE